MTVLEKFVEERISAWESKHGMVAAESRDCLRAVLYHCLKASPEVAARQLAGPPPKGHENCRRRCFCERNKC